MIISHKPTSSNKSASLSEILNNSSLPRFETELLLSFLSDKTREFLLARPGYEFSTLFIRKFKTLEKKRLNNWPLAYLTSQKGFYNLNFKVTPAVLIPRPETEIMVEWLIDRAKLTAKNLNHGLAIIDIGTGSGAIIISVATEIKKAVPQIYKKSNFYGLDISASALAVAKANAKTHRLNKKIIFKRGNLLEALTKELIKAITNKQEIIIAANLPYLTPKQVKESPSISREPKLALVAGQDGLKYYHELFIWIRDFKKEIKQPPAFSLICEIDEAQAKKIIALCKKYFPKAKPKIIRDLNNKKRFLTF
jgi:release factor glutamine methyltransferase